MRDEEIGSPFENICGGGMAVDEEQTTHAYFFFMEKRFMCASCPRIQRKGSEFCRWCGSSVVRYLLQACSWVRLGLHRQARNSFAEWVSVSCSLATRGCCL